MISFIRGDLFDSECNTLVNTINTIGVMGKGIALEYKKRFPEMFKWYLRECQEQKIITGKVYLWKNKSFPQPDIVLFPTKFKWWEKSRINYIEEGLKDFTLKYDVWGITSIAFPQLGCSNGGLKWDDVKPLMKKYLSDLEIYIEIYEKDL